MTDTRYRDQGFSVELLETPSGAFLSIRKGKDLIGEVGVGLFRGGGADETLQVSITRYTATEPLEVTSADDFKD